MVVYCIWTLDRGFEITDEAYYLLLAMHADSVKFFISAQQWITGGIWQITGSLVMFRAAGMFLLVASSSLLAFGAVSAFSQSKLRSSEDVGGRIIVLAASVICALLYSVTINLSPSYNLLAATGAYAAAGLVLLALHTSVKWQRLGLLLLVGSALGVEFVSKVSSGLATLGLVVIWVFIFGRSISEKMLGVAAIIAGFSLFVFALMCSQTTIPDAANSINQGLELFRMVQVESVWARLERNFIELLRNSADAIRAFGILISAVVIYLVNRHLLMRHELNRTTVRAELDGTTSHPTDETTRHPTKQPKDGCQVVGYVEAHKSVNISHGSTRTDSWLKRSIFIGVILASLAYTLVSGKYLLGGTDQFVFQMQSAFVLCVLVLLVSLPAWCKDYKTISLIGGLVALPYSVAIGTGNSLFTQIIISLAPWGTLLALLATSHFNNRADKIIVLILFTGFVMAISLQIITSGFRAPYHMVQPLAEQSQPVLVGNLGSVRVDADTKVFIDDLKSAANTCSITRGAPFLGLYNIPGVALVLQTVPALTPWLNDKPQAEFVMERGSLEDASAAVVALQITPDGALPPLPQRLSTFPTGYRYCGMATYPYMQQKIQIWQYYGK